MAFPKNLDLAKLKEEWQPKKKQMEEAAKEAFVEAPPVLNIQGDKQEKSVKHDNVASTGHENRKHPGILKRAKAPPAPLLDFPPPCAFPLVLGRLESILLSIGEKINQC